MYPRGLACPTLVLAWGEGKGWRRLLERVIKSAKVNRKEFSRGLREKDISGRAKSIKEAEALER